MRTGTVEANLVQLNQLFQLPYIPDLIALKLAGAEKSVLEDAALEFHQQEYLRLLGELEAAHQASHLPESPLVNETLNDLLVRLRIGSRANQ
jgi:hypothetical protein